MTDLLIDRGYQPAAIDGLTISNVARILGVHDDDPSIGSTGMAVASFRARERGEKLTPASATTHAIHGDAIAQALAAKRAEREAS